jgi:hypothetical protein
MRKTSRITTLAAVAAFSVGAAPLAAQTVTLASATAPTSRIVAKYDFLNGPRDAEFPRSVTVIDSAGTIQANLLVADGTRSIPMTVSVVRSDLVLEAETQKGLLTLVFERQNTGGLTRFDTGRWALGTAYGTLQGRGQP